VYGTAALQNKFSGQVLPKKLSIGVVFDEQADINYCLIPEKNK
jgi:hypothetical protein